LILLQRIFTNRQINQMPNLKNDYSYSSSYLNNQKDGLTSSQMVSQMKTFWAHTEAIQNTWWEMHKYCDQQMLPFLDHTDIGKWSIFVQKQCNIVLE